MRSKVAAAFLTLLLASVLASMEKPEVVWASGTIYIRSDGTIDPPTAPIDCDGDTYTFLENINEPVVVEKDDIIIDGNGYTLQGAGSGIGLDLSDRNNVTVKHTSIEQWYYGVLCNASSGNTIESSNFTRNAQRAIFISNSSDNIIRDNLVTSNDWEGIFLWRTNTTDITGNNVSNNGKDGISIVYFSFHNTVAQNTVLNNSYAGLSIYPACTGNAVIGNNITDNDWGIYVEASNANTFYHNNLVDNTVQVVSYVATNAWDNGYHSGGNHWSDYTGLDSNGDGIGDSPHIIDADNQDNYPFMNPWTPQAYDAAVVDVEPSKTYVGQGYDVRINVTVTNQGSYTQTFNITAYANQTEIETKTIVLASQSTQILTFTWNTAGATKAFYTLNATADQMPGEVDTLDNTHKNRNIKVTLAGDVNGDTIVNVHDLFLIGKAYGSTQPRPNWNSNCDINEDSTVSQPDLEIVSENYAHT
jgi:parallel beta-helix repeat protein